LTGTWPVDRARAGSKHHLLVDAAGIPLAISLTGGHRNDVTQRLPLVDRAEPIRGKPGRPRRRAEILVADRAYDHDKYRRVLWSRGVKPVMARRATEHGSGLGKLRWVVERTFAWLHQFRRLRLRWERRPELRAALMHLACAFICQCFLRGASSHRPSEHRRRAPTELRLRAVSPSPEPDRPHRPSWRRVGVEPIVHRAYVVSPWVYFRPRGGPGGSAGVREPRNRPPDAGGGAAQLKPPRP
jgi:transposase